MERKRKVAYFVAQEDDNTYNVFDYLDFDHDGWYAGHYGEEGYHLNDFDIIAEFSNFQDACDYVDKLYYKTY